MIRPSDALWVTVSVDAGAVDTATIEAPQNVTWSVEVEGAQYTGYFC